ncbi:hypothetical protein NORO109296_02030 [Nocardiopsis rhodophaea]
MRAAIIGRPGSITVGERPDPVPGSQEAVIRVGACGICGTDLHIADGEFPPSPYPLAPGNEFAGEVVAVGDGAPGGLRVGDRVAVDPSLFCGYCTFCRSGRGNLCAKWSATGDTVDGAFAARRRCAPRYPSWRSSATRRFVHHGSSQATLPSRPARRR